MKLLNKGFSKFLLGFIAIVAASFTLLIIVGFYQVEVVGTANSPGQSPAETAGGLSE